MKYYQLTYSDDYLNISLGVAYARTDEVFVTPICGEKINNWENIIFDLRDGSFADYLTNDMGVRLVSERFKEIIIKNLTEKDLIQWLSSVVIDKNGDTRNYYILHFPKNFQVIDADKSVINNDMIIKAVFKENKIKYHNIFTMPSCAGRVFFVSNIIRDEIIKNKITGVGFGNVKVSR